MATAGRRRADASRLVCAACWLAALAGIAFLSSDGVRGIMVDLNVYRSGALTVLHGHDLYAMRTTTRLSFTYPPVSALLAVPLAFVPLGAAKLAWVAMIYLPLAVAVWFGFRPLLVRAGRYAPAMAAALVCGCAFLFPIRQEIDLGQIDVFLLGLCLLDCVVPRPRWPRGALIGLATAIKLVPGVFVVYLLITGRRKAAAVAAMCFAAWTAVAFALEPRDSTAYWTSAIFHTRRLGGNGAAGNQSLRGMVLRALAPGPGATAVWLTLAASAAVLGFAAARACWRRGDDMAGVVITGLLAALLSPVAWIHHFCWVVVAVGLIAGECRSWRRIALAAAFFCLFLTMLPAWGQTLLNLGRLPVVPGRLLEDSFGAAALILIAVLYRLRPTDQELLAWRPELGQESEAARPVVAQPSAEQAQT